MRNNQFILVLKYAAVAGNTLFVLWILYNGINEGFRATAIQKFSYFSLMGLLVVNSFLLFSKPNHVNQKQ